LKGRPMSNEVAFGPRLVGEGQPVMVIAEIGINHNGDVDLCKDLITASAEAGCDVVKFQKRTVDVVYSTDELARPRENPFGVTNGDLKRGLEFDEFAYAEIAKLCASLGVAWTASCWDEASVDFIEQFDPPFYKIASASLTDAGLLRHHKETGRPIVMSTGMSSLEEVDRAVEILGTGRLVLMQCTSTYPTDPDELNLRAIATLQARYGVPVGFSGHDRSIATSVAAVALGACVVERHITLNRDLWGSDQSASLEPGEIAQLVRDIRDVERAMGDGLKRIYESEIPVREKLRRVG
jgi:N-acetylneuraminate synthase